MNYTKILQEGTLYDANKKRLMTARLLGESCK